MIELPASLRAGIMAEARAALPRECCGLVEGLRRGEGWKITALHPARNAAVRSDRFEIEPRDSIAAQKAARANGHAIIGCYHSHPHGRAEPSARDLAGAAQEDFLWLIAAGETLAAFIYSRGAYSRGVVTGADWVTSSE